MMTHATLYRKVRWPARLIPLGAFLAALLMLFTACGGSSKSGSPSSSSTTAASTTLVIASPALPTVFARDAAGGTGYENLEYAVNTQSSLIQQKIIPDPANKALLLQDQYNFQGELATSWDISPDGLTYTFHLKQGVKSAAGDPFTADDVVWSWTRKFHSGSTPNTQNPVITDPTTQIKKIDDFTVSFSVTKPGYGFTLMSLLANSSAHIYDSTLLKAHATAADPYAVAYSATDNPNYGYGAYMRTSYTAGTEMVLEANPNYFGTAPKYKKLIYRVTADPASRANTVKSSDSDIAAQIRPADQKDLSSDKSVQIFTFPTTNELTMLPMITVQKPFDNATVRRALFYAVPYQQIIDNVYDGRAKPMVNAMLDPTLPGFNNSGLETATYNPTMAKSLLTQAGFPDGVSFTLTVESDVPDLVQTAIQIQSFAAKGGFTITIDQVPPTTFSTQLVSRKVQALLWRDMAISSSPQYQLALFYKGTAGAPAGSNITGYLNPQYLSIIDQGTALPDPTSAAANVLWNQAEQLIAKDTPMIYIARVQPLNAFRTGISGYLNRLDNVIEFSQLYPS
jgi:peptide/nickel transport system substrate-binding protein